MLNALDPAVTLLDPGLPVCFSYSVVGVSLPPLFGVDRHCQGCRNRYGFGGGGIARFMLTRKKVEGKPGSPVRL